MDASDFPKELFVKPAPLIGLSGLDVKNNAVHKSIWEIFTNNRRPDNQPLNYQLIENSYEFPCQKPKRTSYEWYIPKGLLKKNWMAKYLNRIPALIVIFYDLDWNDAQWNEKMIECTSKVHSMRVALEGRNTKLCLVLIQSTSQNPAEEDSLAMERAAALCTSADLNAKTLFVLPHGDNLKGYSTRLENAFNDLAQIFYQLQIRNVKSHKEHLIKTTHQYLYVRHQFKMGFLNEIRQDLHTAHKHYICAYNNLMEIRIVDTNIMEVRTVAGFINYKLCRLMFALNLARDAISQFKAHIDRYKDRIGFPELAFEHYDWMCKQYSVFGDIFDDAVKQGLPAVQTQHPGIYYQQAVHYAKQRHRSCLEICANVTVYPNPDPLIGCQTMEFYGQRPWRAGKVNNDAPDPIIEQNGIKALQFLEKQIQHYNIVITLYGLAITQFKTYKCPRTRRHLVVQMADEYCASGDYGKALTILMHMILDYRHESWWLILTNVLQKALTCAVITATYDDFIALSLESLSPETHTSHDIKAQIYQNLINVIERQQPPISSNEHAAKMWRAAFDQQPIVELNMNNIRACIDCKARFGRKAYEVHEAIDVEVGVVNRGGFRLEVARVCVGVKHVGKMMEYVVDDGRFVLEQNEAKKCRAKFNAEIGDINGDLQIASINIHLGATPNKYILKYVGGGNQKSAIPHELLHFKNRSSHANDFDEIVPQLTAAIIPRNINLIMNIEHHEPALVGEWYPINIVVINDKNAPINNLELDISLLEDDEYVPTEIIRNIDDTPEKLPIKIQASNLAPNIRITTKLFLRAYKIGVWRLFINGCFIYMENEIPSRTEYQLNVNVMKPFDVRMQYFSARFEHLTKLFLDEEFAVMPIINCLSPWPIIIENTRFEFLQHIDLLDRNTQLNGGRLNDGEVAADICMAKLREMSNTSVGSMGNYIVEWKRCDGESTATSSIQISEPLIDWIPLQLDVDLPAHGVVRTPLFIEYKLTNKSSFIIQIDISIEGSEAFMFSGYKQYHISILPEATKVLKYNLYPLIAGSVILPKMNLHLSEQSMETPALRQEHLNALIARTLPSHIFVMPQKKANI